MFLRITDTRKRLQTSLSKTFDKIGKRDMVRKSVTLDAFEILGIGQTKAFLRHAWK